MQKSLFTDYYKCCDYHIREDNNIKSDCAGNGRELSYECMSYDFFGTGEKQIFIRDSYHRNYATGDTTVYRSLDFDGDGVIDRHDVFVYDIDGKEKSHTMKVDGKNTWGDLY